MNSSGAKHFPVLQHFYWINSDCIVMMMTNWTVDGVLGVLVDTDSS